MRKLSTLLILLSLAVAVNVYLPAAQAQMGQVVIGINGMI